MFYNDVISALFQNTIRCDNALLHHHNARKWLDQVVKKFTWMNGGVLKSVSCSPVVKTILTMAVQVQMTMTQILLGLMCSHLGLVKVMVHASYRVLVKSWLSTSLMAILTDPLSWGASMKHNVIQANLTIQANCLIPKNWQGSDQKSTKGTASGNYVLMTRRVKSVPNYKAVMVRHN
ncbi:hypothetical protein D3C71_1513450 [compost metagenome]